jgi:hypothetical protein
LELSSNPSHHQTKEYLSRPKYLEKNPHFFFFFLRMVARERERDVQHKPVSEKPV